MFDEIIRKANQLLGESQPFAVAVVVRREAPISGQTGDKAIIQADGKIAGWIGGGCTQPLVIKEAQNAIKDGKPRFVRVTPTSGKDSSEGILEYAMTCHSGGTIDVYIEPVLPKTQLLILGKSAVAQALARLGKVLHYRVCVFAPEADSEMFPEADILNNEYDLSQFEMTPQTVIVVATQGQEDEEALKAALKLDSSYLAFVASRKKAESVFQYLKENGATNKQLKRIKVPAGLDIGAHFPEEIAVSILAEIIQLQRRKLAGKIDEKDRSKTAESAGEAKDPICGMKVDIRKAKYVANYQQETYYFCGTGCQKMFEKDPERYLSIAER